MRYVGLLFIVLLALFFPMKTHHVTKAEIAGVPLELEVVSLQEEKARGLSGREFLPANHGMLFVYQNEAQPFFWMKDMLFPIDIIWISPAKKVVGIESEVSPDSYPATFRPQSPVLWVLEVNAGWAAAHGVKEGDVVQVQ